VGDLIALAAIFVPVVVFIVVMILWTRFVIKVGRSIIRRR
jgi:hypothetical protein